MSGKGIALVGWFVLLSSFFSISFAQKANKSSSPVLEKRVGEKARQYNRGQRKIIATLGFEVNPVAKTGGETLLFEVVTDNIVPEARDFQFVFGNPSTFQFNVAITNISPNPLFAPLSITITELTSEDPGPPNVSVANADNGLTNVGALWDYSDDVGDGILEPGEQSIFVTWIFNNPDLESFTIVANVEAETQVIGTISGVVLDTDNNPLPDATVTVPSGIAATTTNDQGQFFLEAVPEGLHHLEIDGSTVTLPGTFPSLTFEIDVIGGQDNTLGMPVYLPLIDTENAVAITPTQDAVVTNPNMPGLSMQVAAGTATFPDGSNSGSIGFTQVPSDKVPMPLPNGLASNLFITIQPGGTVFDPPAPITFPNIDGLAPGTQTTVFGFDHEVGAFVSQGTATVNGDGSLIVADPGTGVSTASWWAAPPPDPSQPTTVIGRVVDCGDNGVAGAQVTTLFANSGTTDGNGNFSISNVPSNVGDITATATVIQNGQTITATSNSVPPNPGGTADVGDIFLPLGAVLNLASCPEGGEQIPNGGFETGAFTNFTTSGEAQVISSLGSITPPEGSFMAFISTGGAAVGGSVSSLSTSFMVPIGACSLSFCFNFVSEEYPEFVGSEFNDFARVTLTTPQGEETVTLASVNCANFFPIGDIGFPGGDDTAGMTGFMALILDVSDVAGTGQMCTLTLELDILDEGDTTFDSALLIDDIKFSTLVQIADKDDNVVDHVQVARWDNVHDASNNVKNKKAEADNFIDLDPEKFFVKITDNSKNTNSSAIDKIAAKIKTDNGGGATDDNLTEIELFETGNNTGVFKSKSQLLCSPDLPVADDPDDDFAAHTGLAGTVADDNKNDRTHRAEIDGKLVVEYEDCKTEVDVCARDPEERRILEVRVHVFNEPPGVDISGDGVMNTVLGTQAQATAHVNAQIVRANIGWAQACIKVIQKGATIFENAPNDAGGNNILGDGSFSTPADRNVVINSFAVGASIDVLEVFFVAPIPGANAFTVGPVDQVAALGEKTFVFMVPNLDLRFRTLAHESGHVLDNGFDNNNPQFIFYPANNTFLDNAVNKYRRITQGTANNARAVRPAGNLTAPGNRMLKTP